MFSKKSKNVFSYNQITDLSPLTFLPNLEVLDLEANHVESGTSIKKNWKKIYSAKNSTQNFIGFLMISFFLSSPQNTKIRHYSTQNFIGFRIITFL